MSINYTKPKEGEYFIWKGKENHCCYGLCQFVLRCEDYSKWGRGPGLVSLKTGATFSGNIQNILTHTRPASRIEILEGLLTD